MVAWNRTAEKAEALAAEHDNVTVAPSAAEAAAQAAIAISMVPDTPEVEAVLLGPGGAAEGLTDGGLAIDMLASGPRDVLVPEAGAEVARDVLLQADMAPTQRLPVAPGAQGRRAAGRRG